MNLGRKGFGVGAGHEKNSCPSFLFISLLGFLRVLLWKKLRMCSIYISFQSSQKNFQFSEKSKTGNGKGRAAWPPAARNEIPNRGAQEG